MRQSFIDLQDPHFLQSLFTSNKHTRDETTILSKIRVHKHRSGRADLIDFQSGTLHSVRDGNTLISG